MTNSCGTSDRGRTAWLNAATPCQQALRGLKRLRLQDCPSSVPILPHACILQCLQMHSLHHSALSCGLSGSR